MRYLYFSLLLLIVACGSAVAAIEEHAFENAEQEARYNYLIDVMRCPKCLNANLAGSDAPIAADLRAEIYSQLQEGRSDDEIIAFMKARYGDFIMYRPPLNPGTLVLWFGPLLLLFGGAFILLRMLGSARDSKAETALSVEEQQHLESFLNTDKDQHRS